MPQTKSLGKTIFLPSGEANNSLYLKGFLSASNKLVPMLKHLALRQV
ncbi:hypothetical protein ACEW7V_02755 [Areca yellow leaf disease phytoplasma]